MCPAKYASSFHLSVLIKIDVKTGGKHVVHRTGGGCVGTAGMPFWCAFSEKTRTFFFFLLLFPFFSFSLFFIVISVNNCRLAILVRPTDLLLFPVFFSTIFACLSPLSFDRIDIASILCSHLPPLVIAIVPGLHARHTDIMNLSGIATLESDRPRM